MEVIKRNNKKANRKLEKIPAADVRKKKKKNEIKVNGDREKKVKLERKTI